MYWYYMREEIHDGMVRVAQVGTIAIPGGVAVAVFVELLLLALGLIIIAALLFAEHDRVLHAHLFQTNTFFSRFKDYENLRQQHEAAHLHGPMPLRLARPGASAHLRPRQVGPRR